MDAIANLELDHRGPKIVKGTSQLIIARGDESINVHELDGFEYGIQHVRQGQVPGGLLDQCHIVATRKVKVGNVVHDF